jgi:hypothetical protein
MIDGSASQEIAGSLFIGLEQRFHFRTQLGVTPASFIQIPGTLAIVSLERLPQNLSNMLPSFPRHSATRSTHG